MVLNLAKIPGAYLNRFHMPTVRWTDILEIIIISFLVYHIMVWIKETRAWSLLRGLLVIIVFAALAALLNMSTIIWIVEHVLSIAVIACIVVLQPELRRALEQLGRKNILASIISFDSTQKGELFSDKTVKELVLASFAMSKVKTGALIVIAQNQSLSHFEGTGIEVDGIVTSQLLINIFEKNTPLHDGAVIVNGNRVVSATCYLPLSDNMELSKALGTRHRAAVGISEVTDSLTIVVSEETGNVSVAYEGKLEKNLTQEQLLSMLSELQNKKSADKRRILWKGRRGNEKRADKKSES